MATKTFDVDVAVVGGGPGGLAAAAAIEAAFGKESTVKVRVNSTPTVCIVGVFACLITELKPDLILIRRCMRV